MGNIKNKFFKKTLCVLLCVLFCCNIIAAAVYTDEIGTEIDIEIEIESGEPLFLIHPWLDELIDLYVKYSLYDVTREEAIDAMLSNLLADHPGLLTYLGRALLTSNDNYGAYYPFGPDNNSGGVSLGNTFVGYGIRISGKNLSNGHAYNTKILQVFPNSPAMRAGLKPGDEIIKIDGVILDGLGMNAVSHLLASSGIIEITVKRGEEEYVTVSMGKAVVASPSVYFEITEINDNEIAVITIDDFHDTAMVYILYYLLGDLKEYGIENVILDLRNNLGGYLYLMIDCLNLFVTDKDIVLLSEIDKSGDMNSIKSTGIGFEFEKLCVLVNNHSASAAELFALSLSELTGAAIIGEKTAGKGVGQNYFTLANRDTAIFTTLEAISANGTRYNNIGVMPDIKISPEYKDVERINPGQLNFVNCRAVKKDAENNAVLALNQRLAIMGYISPDNISAKCTELTVNAVEIFQRANNLPVGIEKIDYIFLEYLNAYVTRAARGRYIDRDIISECAYIYINQGMEAAEDFAGEFVEED
ncbi:MAG: S41 family peptidase [Oscillospiraceae bacterium]|nr:S41 family peptidase [Oscillospiraceae bacterium]